MVIGSKWQLKSLNLDDFTISVDSDKLFLARQARYLGLWERNPITIYIGMIQGALRIWICICHGAPRRFIKEVFLYKGSSLWNKLPPWVKNLRL